MTEQSFYTTEMRRAFHNIVPPENFSVTIAEHSAGGTLLFLEIIVSEKDIMSLDETGRRGAIVYMMKVRDALMQEGAIVQISRSE